MVAASTLRTRSGRRPRAQTSKSGANSGTNDDDRTELEQLRARITELEKSRPQQPVTIARQDRMPIGKPFKFDGVRDDQKVRLWLSEIDTLLKE
jgi:hypothetical protein